MRRAKLRGSDLFRRGQLDVERRGTDDWARDLRGWVSVSGLVARLVIVLQGCGLECDGLCDGSSLAVLIREDRMDWMIVDPCLAILISESI